MKTKKPEKTITVKFIEPVKPFDFFPLAFAISEKIKKGELKK